MFVAEKLIYLQLQKTACTHIASVMSELIEGEQRGKHNRLEKLDSGKAIVGSIRNPWDWYVSLWAFGCGGNGGIFSRSTHRNFSIGRKYIKAKLTSKPRKREKFKYLNNTDIIKFNMNELTKPVRKWKRVYTDPSARQNFKTWLFQIHDPSRKWDHGGEFSMSSLSDFAGLMTYRYSSLFIEDFFQPNNFKKIRNISDLSNLDSQNNILDFIIHTENLEADLIRVLTESGYPLDQEIKQAIHQHADNRINTSQHEKYVYYHDQETINLIAEKDRLIIEKYGYTSPNIVGLR